MKNKLLLAVLSGGLLTLTGCMSSNAKRFFAENKGYAFDKVVISLSTPWGTEVISADKITSTVAYVLGTNNLLLLPPGATMTTNGVPVGISSSSTTK